jgi:hypothetical protein
MFNEGTVPELVPSEKAPSRRVTLPEADLGSRQKGPFVFQFQLSNRNSTFIGSDGLRLTAPSGAGHHC